MRNFVLLLLLSFSAWCFEVPNLTGPIVDQVGVLSPEFQRGLSQKLQKYHSQGRAQIQILIVPDLGGLTIEEYSMKVADQWKIGHKGKDNGTLLLVAITERRVRIEVGRGLEGIIPDIEAGRIIQNNITPHLKARNFEGAVSAFVYQVLLRADREYPGIDSLVPQDSMGYLSVLLLVALLGFWILVPRRFLRGSRLGHGSRAPWGGGGWSGGGGGFSGGGASGNW